MKYNARIATAKLRAIIMSVVTPTAGLPMNELVKLPSVEALGVKRSVVESTTYAMKKNGLLRAEGVVGSNQFTYFKNATPTTDSPHKDKPEKVHTPKGKPGFTVTPGIRFLKNGNVVLTLNGLAIELGVEK